MAHTTVQRTTSSGVISSSYTQAGDRASTNTTHRIDTGVANPVTGDFGVNVMRVQAGLPAGQAVVYVAFGGTTLTNVGGAGQAVWQNISVSQEGINTNCVGEPNFFLIQSPAGTATTVTVNGVPLTLHSTVGVRVNADGSITVMVIEGSIDVGGQTVNAGFKVTVRVVNGVVVVEAIACLEAADLASIQTVLNVPSNLLNEVITGPVVSNPSGVGGAQCVVS